MGTANGPKKMRSGVHATRRTLISSNQPLKPIYLGKRALLLMLTLFVGLGLLIQQNYRDISRYLNRPVTKVRIENQWQQISNAEVRMYLASYMGSGFFDFDVNGVKQELEQHPWVSLATVKRIWPDTVSVQLTEQVAIARWGGSQLLNQRGEIFEPSNMENLSALPQLSGPELSQYEVMEQYQLFTQILFPAGLRLTGLSLSPRGSWGLTLNEEMQVAVGRIDVNKKLERFVDFYAGQPALQTALFQSIDLRYSNGIAIRSANLDLTGVAIR